MADVEDLIDNIATGDYNKASSEFEQLIADKLSDALDAKRADVAAQIYGDQLEDDNELDNEEISDEDLDDAAEQALEEYDEEQ